MNCPCCSIQLRKTTLEEIEIDQCEKCKGIWFEHDELRQAKDAADKDLNWMDFEIWKQKDLFSAKPANLACPQCNKPLVTIDYADTKVAVDCCPACKGTWLDNGEFKKILDALNNELLSKTFSQYIRASIAEAKEIVTGPEGLISEWKDFTTVLRMMKFRLYAENPDLVDQALTIQRSIPIR